MSNPDKCESDLIKLQAENERLRELLARYRRETPLGHQPHMIAAEVDMLLASASSTLGKDQVQSEASRHVVPPGYVLVPKTALDWLNGEGPDEDGVWFGDSPRTGMYWWRSRFRAMISAAPGIEAFGQDPKGLGAEHESPKGAPNPSEGGEK